MTLFFKSTHRYAAIDKESDLDREQPSVAVSSRRLHFTSVAVLATIVLLTAGFIGFQYGRKTGAVETRLDWLTPAGGYDHTFTYHHDFAAKPTNATEHLWERMFPAGRGFVQHPDISPEPHGLAIYHQLHCLDAVRRSYYAAIDGVNLTTIDRHLAPGHVRHCVDYLRQSIMCCSDTNLEPINMDLGGVTGFGFSRKCRAPEKLIQWANQWRTHNETDIS